MIYRNKTINKAAMTLRSKHSQGFTIVELLVVVVVMGILVLLILEAFNGTQIRARNVVRIERAKVLYDALANYHIFKGAYPDNFGVGPDRYVCTGRNNPDSNGDGVGDCENWGDIIDQSEAFNASMAEVVSVPDGLKFPYIVGNGGQHFRGVSLVSEPSLTTIDGVARPYLTFALEGTGQDCRVTNTIIGGPNIYVTGPDTMGFTPAGSDITLCNLPFPDKN